MTLGKGRVPGTMPAAPGSSRGPFPSCSGTVSVVPARPRTWLVGAGGPSWAALLGTSWGLLLPLALTPERPGCGEGWSGGSPWCGPLQSGCWGGLWGHAVKGGDGRWSLTAQQPLLGWGSSGQWVLLPRAPLGCQRPRSASCARPCDRASGMGHGGASQAPGVHPGGGQRTEGPTAPVLGGKVTGFSLSRGAAPKGSDG